MALRSSILLLVPDAEPLVGELRAAHDPAAFAGVNAHVTILFPFVPAPEIDDHIIAKLATQIGGGALELTFDRVGRFPGLVYLAVADPAPLIAMTCALEAAWPAYPLYEGKYPNPVPHLTVALGEEAVLDAIEDELRRRLPLVTTVTHATLMCEDEASRWSERAWFAL